MGVAKPSGEYADEMLDPGGWVETDEQSLYDRAQQYTQILQQTTTSLEGFQHERSEIFDGGVFEGTAASAAKGKLDEVIDDLTGLQQHLVSAITWYQKAGDTVAKTKSTIADRVDATQKQISDLEDDSDSDSDDQADAIEKLVNQAHGENIKDVTNAAATVPAAGTWKAPANALENLLNQKAPPPATKPGQSPPGPAQQTGKSGMDPAGAPAARPGQVSSPTPSQPGAPVAPGSQPARPGDVSTAVQPGMPGGVPAAAGAGAGQGKGSGGFQPGTPGEAPPVALPPTPEPAPGGIGPNEVVRQVSGGFSGLGGFGGGGGGGGHGGGDLSSMWGNALGGQQGGQQNPFSAEAFEHHLERQDAGLQQAMNQSAVNNAASAAASAATNTAAQLPLADAAAPMAPAAAHGPTAAEASAAAASTGGGAVSAGGHVGGAVGASMSSAESSASSMPLLPPATPHAAAPVLATGGGGAPGAANTGSGGPGVHPASTTSVGRAGFGGSVTSAQAEAAPAPIPVSSARAQKEAIADATRRQSGGGDVQMAYRLAAALNAADMVNKGDFKFFWMTAVTADGQIVVANSYGLAFIPDGVNLPVQAIMVSADGAVPVEERARWATYPNLALQGWAAHHNTTLRIVIAKREHFAGIDPGVPTQFVADEDIPASGKIQGRPRLEVIAPDEAGRLASLSDLGLVEMLPPAPVDASPPADQRSTLWFDLVKHLMSSDADRGVAHLQSFATYASHAQDLAMHRAHSAVHAVEQRDAVADWLYWQRIGELLEDALASASR